MQHYRTRRRINKHELALFAQGTNNTLRPKACSRNSTASTLLANGYGQKSDAFLSIRRFSPYYISQHFILHILQCVSIKTSQRAPPPTSTPLMPLPYKHFGILFENYHRSLFLHFSYRICREVPCQDNAKGNKFQQDTIKHRTETIHWKPRTRRLSYS